MMGLMSIDHDRRAYGCELACPGSALLSITTRYDVNSTRHSICHTAALHIIEPRKGAVEQLSMIVTPRGGDTD